MECGLAWPGLAKQTNKRAAIQSLEERRAAKGASKESNRGLWMGLAWMEWDDRLPQATATSEVSGLDWTGLGICYMWIVDVDGRTDGRMAFSIHPAIQRLAWRGEARRGGVRDGTGRDGRFQRGPPANKALAKSNTTTASRQHRTRARMVDACCCWLWLWL